MSYNSTIRDKIGICVDCDDGRMKKLVSNRCQTHYSKYRNLISQQRIAQREATKDNVGLEEKELHDLISDLDAIYSRWLRLSSADENGNVVCFTCGNVLSWKKAHCGHYISRKTMFLRWDTRNTKIQDEQCNVYKYGNIAEYTKRLEAENKGITDILIEESALIHKWSREELRQMIAEYSSKIDVLKEERKTITNN